MTQPVWIGNDLSHFVTFGFCQFYFHHMVNTLVSAMHKTFFFSIFIALFLVSCKLGQRIHRDTFGNQRVDYHLLYNNRRPSHTPYMLSSYVWNYTTKFLEFGYHYYITRDSLEKGVFINNRQKDIYVLKRNEATSETIQSISFSKLDSIVVTKTMFYLDSLGITNYDLLRSATGLDSLSKNGMIKVHWNTR